METLSLPDILIILLYFASVLFVGIRVGKKDESMEGYVAGGRKVPWLAVLGSLVATEISAATFLGTPGVGYSSNLGYLQITIGSLLARFAIAFVFLTAFYKARYLSIYQYLATRFGSQSHYSAAVFFLLSRILASAVRLMIASTGLHIILGIPFIWTMIAFALLCLVYAGIGGIRAVIWTDCIQAIVFLTAGLVMLVVLQDLVGWGTIFEAGKNILIYNIHNSLLGLLGYLILFATQAFVPQRQLLHRGLPSPLSVPLVSKHFITTPMVLIFSSHIKL